MDRDTEAVVELVEVIAKALVDKPDDVVVEAFEGRHSRVVELSVDSADIGKIIGKKGRTAKCIKAAALS